jgi:lysophospholipase L1-like esterase
MHSPAFARRSFVITALSLAALAALSWAKPPGEDAQSRVLLMVGAARRDITPDYPVRLSGYGSRREPSKGVAQRIHAKALAFGDDGSRGPSILITVDNCGVPASIRSQVLRRVAAKVPVQDRNFAICSSHTHCAPMLAGILQNLFGEDIPAEHQAVIERYTREFTDSLVSVCLDALENRRPSQLAWAVGSVPFATNRRQFPMRPVDHALPVLRVSDPDGKITAILTNYACHCTTIGIDQIHADWAGCAQEAMERAFPGAVALTAIGCGADQNPMPRRTIELAVRYGESIAAEAAHVVSSQMIPLRTLPEGKAQFIELAYDTLPTREGWQALATGSSRAVAYHAQKNLARLDRGEALPQSLPYMVQTWTFGNDLAMVFLPGEVVVDYSLRIKTEFDHRRVWVNAYSNDVPAYIPSKRVWEEGGYEGGSAMIYYDRPTRFAGDVESRILTAVRALVPSGYASSKQDSEQPASPFIASSPRLTLPPHLYAVEGNQLTVFFANTILAADPAQFRFEVECPVGHADKSQWSLPASHNAAGEHPFVLKLYDARGGQIQSASATLHVVATGAPSRADCRVLLVGDSLTAAGVYPDQLASLFAQPNNPKLHMLGTQTRKPAQSTNLHVAFEGYGGWSWKGFLSRYDLQPAEPGKVNKSPFVFPRGEPPVHGADFQRYIHERLGGVTPDIICVLLGINDCFRLKADEPTAMDQGITEMLFHAETLVGEFRKAAPQATIGICLVPPPNDRESAFEANYKGQYSRWNWRRVQHRLVERQLKHFSLRGKELLEVIPTELSVDTWNGYPDANAVHPNEAGYRQIASSLHAWIRHTLSRLEAAKDKP